MVRPDVPADLFPVHSQATRPFLNHGTNLPGKTENLPDRSLITVVNKAEVRLVGETDKDSSQLVIEKPFAGGLPATGPAVEVMLTVSGLLGTAGIVLMKRASIS